MRQETLGVALAAVLMAAALIGGWAGDGSQGLKPDVLTETDTIPRHVRFNYTIHNTGNRMVRGAKFHVYAPILQTGTQRVETIESAMSHRVARDPVGQQLLVFDLPDLPPFGRLELAYASRLQMTDTPNIRTAKVPLSYLQPQALIESDHPQIQSMARRLNARDPIAASRNFYQWVADNLTYTGPSGQDRGALHALEARRGDCTDAAFLVVALCRAAGIPARCVGGYVCHQDKNLAAREFHNWAEFWVDGRWQVADPVNRCFADRQETYIATRIWEAADAAAPPPFWRHRIEGAYLKARMAG